MVTPRVIFPCAVDLHDKGAIRPPVYYTHYQKFTFIPMLALLSL